MSPEPPARTVSGVVKSLPAFLLAANIAYLLVLPSTAGKAMSSVGCLVGLLLFVGPLISTRFANRCRTDLPPISSAAWAAPVLAFALPALSLVEHRRIAFWRLDGRALVIVAWLITVSWLIAMARAHAANRSPTAERPDSRPSSLLIILFVVWGSLFWLTLVWDIGIGRAVLGAVREDRITWTFELWETRPPSEHLFLAWLTRDHFARREAYANHLHPYLFFLYGSSRVAQFATGLPAYVGRNLTPFAMILVGIAAFTSLLSRSVVVSGTPGPKFWATLFLVLGFFISESHYWIYLYTTNFDSIFPLIAYLAAIVWAAAQPRITDRNAGLVIASAALFAAFGWVYTPILIFALWCSFGRTHLTLRRALAENQVLVRATVVCGVIGALTYGLPRALIAVKGYSVDNSPFLFRSGLDGDTKFFHDITQAVFRPNCCAPRTWWTLLFPAFVPVLVYFVWGLSRMRMMRVRLVAEYMFLSAPYFFSLALFPQSVSIHPYLYDQLLFIPAVLIGTVGILTPRMQHRLRGPYLLAGLLTIAALIMANLIAVAQAVQAAFPA